MKSGKKWLWRGALAVLGIILAAIIYTFAHPQPAYGGRKLSSWFHEAEMRNYFIEGGPAAEAIHEMGPAATPYLARKLWHEDTSITGTYKEYYDKAPPRLKHWLPEPPPVRGMRQACAAMFLAELGPEARAVYPDMLGVYDRAYCRQFHLPPGTVLNWSEQFTNPPVAPVTTNKTPLLEIRLRLWLIEGIASTGDDKQTVPLLLAAMHEPNYASLASYYLSARTNLVPAIELARPTVLAALQDSSPMVRSTAVRLVGAIAPEHPEMIAMLIQAAGQDSDTNVRTRALEALVSTPMDLKVVLPLLARMLDSGDSNFRGLAVRKLISGGGGGAKFIGTLTDALDNPDPAVRAAAARALRNFSGRAKHAVPKLTELTKENNEPDKHVREEATAALAQIMK